MQLMDVANKPKLVIVFLNFDILLTNYIEL